MDYCTECGIELEEVELICSECREPLCERCHSDNGGMCSECYDKYYSEDDE